MKKIILSLILSVFSVTIYAQTPNLIPFPNRIQNQTGSFVFKPKVSISFPEELKGQYLLIQTWLNNNQIESTCVKKGGNIRYLQTDNLGDEGYQLEVTHKQITIKYSKPAGAFYALQTLKQLLKKEDANVSIPCLTIEDQPAFAWRAFMLDEGRYFKGKVIVKQLMDEMAALKMNTFHWHLTEEVGWRIEIKKYPLFTEVGGHRDSCRFGGLFDPKPHSGYYTQEDIKEIIQYAAERYIQIIPEIDIPGHSSAAIAAYPVLGTHKQPLIMGNTYDVINVTDPQAIKIIEDMLTEVAELFPASVIHIGGDEVGTWAWEGSQQVKDYMKEHNITTYSGLQIEFTNHLSNFLAKKGKRMMGWNEITGDLHPDNNQNKSQLATNVIVHFWDGDISLIKKSIEKGYDVVNSDRIHTYLDYYYDFTPLSKAYSFSPIPDGLTLDQQKKIKGLGCQMWGEKIRQIEDMYYYIFPRIAAFAECGWTRQENKNYERFDKAIQPIIREWKAKGYYTSDENRK